MEESLQDAESVDPGTNSAVPNPLALGQLSPSLTSSPSARIEGPLSLSQNAMAPGVSSDPGQGRSVPRPAYVEDADEEDNVDVVGTNTEHRTEPSTTSFFDAEQTRQDDHEARSLEADVSGRLSSEGTSSLRDHLSSKFEEESEAGDWTDNYEYLTDNPFRPLAVHRHGPDDTTSQATSQHLQTDGPDYGRGATGIDALFPGRCERLGNGRVRVKRPSLPAPSPGSDFTPSTGHTQNPFSTEKTYPFPSATQPHYTNQYPSPYFIPPPVYQQSLGYNHIAPQPLPSMQYHAPSTTGNNWNPFPTGEASHMHPPYIHHLSPYHGHSMLPYSQPPDQISPPIIHPVDAAERIPAPVDIAPEVQAADDLKQTTESSAIVSCSLPTDQADVGPFSPSYLWVRPWNEKKVSIAAGGETELLTVACLEQYADESGESAITLVRDGSHDHTTPRKSIPLRWLHLKMETPSLNHFKDLVYYCPHISSHAKFVASTVLNEVESKMITSSTTGQSFKPGSVVRYDGKYDYDPMKTDESVVFFAISFITLKAAAKHGRASVSAHSARSLLQFLYNYEPDDDRNLQQVVSEVHRSCSGTLHVSQLWCMLIGEDIIITCAEIPQAEVFGPNITISHREALCTVRLVMPECQEHFIPIEPPISYLEFERLVFATTKAPEHSEILDSDLRALTAEKWLELMSMQQLQELSFTIRFPSATNEELQMKSQLVRHRPAEMSFGRTFSHSQAQQSDVASVANSSLISHGPREMSALLSVSSWHTDKSRGLQRRIVESAPLYDTSSFSGSESASVPQEDLHHTQPEPASCMDLILYAGPKGDITRPQIPSPGVADRASQSGSITPDSSTQDADAAKRARQLSIAGEESSSDPWTSSEEISSDAWSSDEYSGTTRNRSTKSNAQDRKASIRKHKPLRSRLHRSETSPYKIKETALANDFVSRAATDASRGNSPRRFGTTGSPSRSVVDAYALGNAHQDRLTAANLMAQTEKLQRMEFKGKVVNDWASINGRAETYNVDTSSSGGSIYDHSRRHSAYAESEIDGHETWPSSRTRSFSPGVFPRNSSKVTLPRRYSARYETSDMKSTLPSLSDPLRYEQHPPESSQTRGVRFDTSTAEQRQNNSAPQPSSRKSWNTQPVSPSRSSSLGPQQQNASSTLLSGATRFSAFFTWKFSRKGNDVAKLLSTIEISLGKRPETGHMYDTCFECTFIELKMRHDFLAHIKTEGDLAGSAAGSDNRDFASTADAMNDFSAAAPANLNPEVSFSNGGDSRSEQTFVRTSSTAGGQSTQTTEAGHLNDHSDLPLDCDRDTDALVAKFLRLSTSVMEQFVPDLRGPRRMHDGILKKYWGSLDRIFRTVRVLQSFGSSGPRQRHFVMKLPAAFKMSVSPDHVHSVECAACKNRKPYLSLRQAIEHLHSVHGQEHKHAHKLLDDPCTVWIESYGQAVGSSTAADEFVKLADSILRDAISGLSELQRVTRELHMSIAVQPAASKKSQENIKRLPALPSSIVRAFENVVFFHLHTATQLFHLSRRKGTATSAMDTAGVYRAKVLEKALTCLHNAKRGLIMPGIATTVTGGVTLEPVGAHYLMAVVVAHLQNRPLRVSDSDTVQDIDIHKEYAAMLRFQIHQRPQRRLFLKIRGLEEEIDAMQLLAESQQRVYDKLMEVFDPDTFRITSRNRQDLFLLEKPYLIRRKTNLASKQREYRALHERVKDLKVQMQQSIDILEEGHGKAIRVFTIVTLFFLPMSFISSFMGMNTTDIRDTSRDQAIFWIVAIPVTVVVLAIALVYAYRGDVIIESLEEMLASRRRRNGRQDNFTQASTRPMPNPAEFISIGAGGEDDAATLVAGEKAGGGGGGGGAGRLRRGTAATRRVKEVLRSSGMAVMGQKVISRRPTDDSLVV